MTSLLLLRVNEYSSSYVVKPLFFKYPYISNWVYFYSCALKTNRLTKFLSGQVKMCYDDTLTLYDGCPPSLPVVQWITKVKEESRWNTEPFFLVLIGSNSFEDITRNCRNSEDMLAQIFQLSSAQFDFLSHRQARVLVFDERKRPNANR